MTNEEREDFCISMAGLFAAPERGDTGLCRDAASSLPRHPMPGPAEDPQGAAGLPLPRVQEVFVPELQEEYRRLFAGAGPSVSLIESSYKPWTTDPLCRLSFARQRNLLMGDSALHMAALYQSAGLELPKEFGACPDHLVLELEFLAALYRAASDREVKQFICDHLDWVPRMREKLMELRPHPYYRGAAEALDLFLRGERERLEKKEDG